MSSIAVLDLHYLYLDEAKLNELSLRDRLKLLFAPYLVEDGMNEHGVAVSSMAAEESKFSMDADKPSVIKVLMKRLILDYARNTDEALDLLRAYNIDCGDVPTHFMIADRQGHSVLVEFHDGEMKVLPATANWQVATNHLLAGKSEATNDERCWRYAVASDRLDQIDGEPRMEDVMKIMSSISVPDWTMWTSVYDLNSGAYHIAYRRQYDDVFVGQLTMSD